MLPKGYVAYIHCADYRHMPLPAKLVVKDLCFFVDLPSIRQLVNMRC